MSVMGANGERTASCERKASCEETASKMRA
jgi:hypothetical protein